MLAFAFLSTKLDDVEGDKHGGFLLLLSRIITTGLVITLWAKKGLKVPALLFTLTACLGFNGLFELIRFPLCHPRTMTSNELLCFDFHALWD